MNFYAVRYICGYFIYIIEVGQKNNDAVVRMSTMK